MRQGEEEFVMRRLVMQGEWVREDRSEGESKDEPRRDWGKGRKDGEESKGGT
jgi:hypothetical protein